MSTTVLRIVALVAWLGGIFSATAQQRDGGASGVFAAVLRVLPQDVVIHTVRDQPQGSLVSGHAKSHDRIADLVRALSGIVSTPKGLGRVVQRSATTRTVRVELLETARTELVEFADNETSRLDVSLVRAERNGEAKNADVHFEILVHAR